jgi:hypothetical protein
MPWINPLYEEYQRRRWLRHDWQRFIRHDAHRFLTPAGLEAERRAAEAQARAEFAAEHKALDEGLWRIRRDLADLKAELGRKRAGQRREIEELRLKSDMAFARCLRTLGRRPEQAKAGFNPAQPRDDHGKWTDSGHDAGKDGPERDLPSMDISAQRRIGARPAGTPAQHARLDAATAKAREAIGRVQQIQPNWRPQSATSFDNRSNMEVMIRAKEAETREAEARYIALSRAGHDDAYPQRNARTPEEFLVPGGEPIGSRTPRAAERVRTVTSAKFEELRIELMGSARRIDSDPSYNGVWYRRQDGSEFGLRISQDHGLTIDILRSDHPLLRRGFRIHQR